MRESYGLTPRQAQLLQYLRSRAGEPVSPTYREMAKAVGENSTSGVHRLVHALEKRGHVKLIPGAPRSVVVVS